MELRQFKSGCHLHKNNHTVRCGYFYGILGYFKCSGQVNCPCAKVFACGENACTAHSRRPNLRGPGLVRHLYFADKTKEIPDYPAKERLLLPGGRDFLTGLPRIQEQGRCNRHIVFSFKKAYSLNWKILLYFSICRGKGGRLWKRTHGKSESGACPGRADC